MTAEEMVANPAAKMAAKTAVPSIIPADDERALRRWIFAAAVVVLVHAAIVFWILYVRDLRPAGVQPEAIMIELAPVDVAPPDEASAVLAPGPQMQQAAPEEIRTVAGDPDAGAAHPSEAKRRPAATA